MLEVPEGYKIELGEYFHDYWVKNDEGPGELHIVVRSIPGQPSLTIERHAWKPEEGLIVWGNAGEVSIESEPPHHYERIGYTRLREKQQATKEAQQQL